MNPILAALVQAGALTPDEAQRLNRLLDHEAARTWAEGQIASAFARGLRLQQGRMARLLQDAGGRITDDALRTWWQAQDQELARAVVPALQSVASDQALVSVARTGGLEHWRAVNTAVIGWTEEYYLSLDAGVFGSLPNLNDASRTAAGNLISAWQRGELDAPGEGLEQLIGAMGDVFAPGRAARIAVTEVTRIFAESTRQAALANPAVLLLRWSSVSDSLVCPICGPLHMQAIPKQQRTFPGGYFPPAHPGCRCILLEESAVSVQVAPGAAQTGAAWSYRFA